MFLTPIRGADKKTMAHLKRLAAFYRRRARKAAVEAARAEKKRIRDAEIAARRSSRRMERVEDMQGVARRRLDGFIRHPTAIGAEMLAEMVKNPKIQKELRVEAAEILLKWANGDFTHSKRRRRGKAI